MDPYLMLMRGGYTRHADFSLLPTHVGESFSFGRREKSEKITTKKRKEEKKKKSRPR